MNLKGERVSEEAIAKTGGPRFGGSLIRPGDGEYDTARKIWNACIDKRPGIIARCTGTADVVTAVNFAREHHLLVAIRRGGHNVGGRALCDGGIVIDSVAHEGDSRRSQGPNRSRAGGSDFGRD
jgi:hypothetical protein